MKLSKMLCRMLLLVHFLCHTHALSNTYSQFKPVKLKYPIKTVIKEATTQAPPKKKKALVAVYGVFSRSLRSTWPQINRMIVKPLEKDYDVEIYGFNNQVDNIDTLDGRPIQKSSADTIKTKHKLVYQEVKQSQLDVYIKQHNSWLTESWVNWYNPATKKNAIRQFYVEQQVSNYITGSEESYAMVVALIADIYPYVPISTRDIEVRDNIIYTSGMFGAMTNGYYVGSKHSVSSTMATVNLIESLDKHALAGKEKSKSYEVILADTLRSNKLERRITDMLFCKLRNNLACAYLDGPTNAKAFKGMSWSQKLCAYFEQFPVLKPMKRVVIIVKFSLVICIVLFISRQAIKWFKHSPKA